MLEQDRRGGGAKGRARMEELTRRGMPWGKGKSARLLICPDVQPFLQKYFCFSEAQISLYPPCPVPREGRWPSSRTLGRDAVDADALQTSGAKADGEVVWS